MVPTSMRSALVAAQAGASQAKILFVGDSFMEGEGASARANRCLDRLVAGFRSLYGIGGSGIGLTPAGPYGTYLSVSAGWRTPATNSGTITPGWFGAQGNTHGRQFDTAGDYVQWTVTGTHADIVYAKSNVGTGDLQVRVDGTLILTINADVGYSPGEIQRISLGASGSHTVRLTSTGSLALVDGIMVYDGDDTAGVTYWDCARTQYTAASFETSLDYRQGWPKFLPQLVVDDLVGTNEYLNNTGGTPAQAATSATSRFNAYKALASSPTIILLIPLRGSAIGVGANGRGYTWDQYVTAIKAAAVTADVMILDLNDYYTGVSKTGWYDADNLHPSDIGHQKMADAILATVGIDAWAEAVAPAALTLTGLTPALSGSGAVVIPAEPAALSLSGLTAELTASTAALPVDSSTVTLAGITPAITGSGAVIIPVDPAVLSLAGITALTSGVAAGVPVDPGALTLSGADAQLRGVDLSVQVDAAAVALTGVAGALAAAGATSAPVDPGVLTLTAVMPATDSTIIVEVDPTILSLTGQTPALSGTVASVIADIALLTLTGQSSGLAGAVATVAVDAALLALSGQTPSTGGGPIIIPVDAAILELAGIDTALTGTASAIPVDPAVLALAGITATAVLPDGEPGFAVFLGDVPVTLRLGDALITLG